MIKLLREAILEQDWDKAISAYESFTGENWKMLHDKQGRGGAETEEIPAPPDASVTPAPQKLKVLLPTEEEVAEFGQSDEFEEKEFFDEPPEGIIEIEDDEDIEDVEEIAPPKRPKADDDDIIDMDDEEAEEKSKCRRVPFDKSKKKNTWVDKKTIAMQDVAFDKKVRTAESLANRNIEKRAKPKKVRVTCHKCNKKFILEDASLAPAVIGRKHGGERANFTCDRCISRQRGRD